MHPKFHVFLFFTSSGAFEEAERAYFRLFSEIGTYTDHHMYPTVCTGSVLHCPTPHACLVLPIHAWYPHTCLVLPMHSDDMPCLVPYSVPMLISVGACEGYHQCMSVFPGLSLFIPPPPSSSSPSSPSSLSSSPSPSPHPDSLPDQVRDRAPAVMWPVGHSKPFRDLSN